jgi:hypothetical protein
MPGIGWRTTQCAMFYTISMQDFIRACRREPLPYPLSQGAGKFFFAILSEYWG